MIIDVITILSTFIATLIGIIGNTWDSKKEGLSKLTVTGRIAVVIAIIAIILAGIQIKEKNRKAISTQQLQSIALNEINSELYELIFTLYILADAADTSNRPDILFNEFNLNRNAKSINVFIDSCIVQNECLDTLHLTFYPENVGLKYQNYQMWQLMEKTYLETRNNSYQIISIYKEYIPLEILVGLNDLFSDDFYKLITLNIPLFARSIEGVRGKRTYNPMTTEHIKLLLTDRSNYDTFIDKYNTVVKCIKNNTLNTKQR
ncbi:hypothetical protein [Flammeovirga aprica]|uniref:Uncharacterized protein n=1 Tax=Flammeovirga aprica JL-4 TaxID=694437 RepID=A0A7X9RWX6_9BACT|nr:hypothetical protein [Flammeovirga aprica]NME70221.1 hypothetical protein [Flammeovirga aprica JL-4]